MRIRRIVLTALAVTAVVLPGTPGAAMAASKSPMAVSVSAASKSPMSVAPGSFSATSKSPMATEPKGAKSSVNKSSKTP